MLKRLLNTLSFHNLLILLALITLFQGGFERFADDPGVGWHLETGRIIWETGRIPRSDPFLESPFSSPRPWVSDQWLSDLLLYVLYKHGSWELVYAFLTAVFFSTFMVFFRQRTAFICGSSLMAACAAFVALKFSTIHFILRPVLLSFPLFSFVLLKCFSLYRLKTSLSPRTVLELALAFVLWANLHPSFVLGLLLMLILPIAICFDRLGLGEFKHSSQTVQAGLLLFLLSSAATLLNPYGFALHQSILSLAENKYFLDLHEEWKALNVGSPEGSLFLFTAGMLLFVVLLTKGEKVPWRSFELALSLLFTSAALSSVRFLPYWAMTAAVLVADALPALKSAYLLQGYYLGRKLSDFLARLEQHERKSRLGLILSSVIALALPIYALLFRDLPWAAKPLGPSQNRYPYDAVSIMLQESSVQRVFSHPNWGGFITWFGQGRLRPFIDDRNTLLGSSFHRHYMEQLESKEQLIAYATSLKADWLLLPASNKLIKELENTRELKLTHKDEVSFLFKLVEK